MSQEPGLSGASGIDCQHDAGDVAGFVADQKFDRVRYIVNLGEPAQCAAPHDLAVLLAGQALGHFGIHKARRDRVDIDSERSNLASERTGKANDGRLGGSVCGETLVSVEADDGGDVDDAAASLSHHRPHYILGQDDRSEDVQMDEIRNAHVMHRRQQAARAQCRIVDEAIDWSELLPQSFDQIVKASDIRQIEGPEVKGAASFAFDLAHRAAEFLALAPCDGDNAVAGTRELARNRKTQSTAAANESA